MPKKSKHVSKGARTALTDAVRESMLQIWQAGLGAFSQAQREGGKLFAKLARDGAELQDRGRELACESTTGLAQSARKIAGEVSRQAAGPLRKVETQLERRMSDALHTLGVPVRRDLHQLIERIERLSATVEALARERAAAEAPRPSARKRAAGATKSKVGLTKAPAKALGKQRTANPAAGRM